MAEIGYFLSSEEHPRQRVAQFAKLGDQARTTSLQSAEFRPGSSTGHPVPSGSRHGLDRLMPVNRHRYHRGDCGCAESRQAVQRRRPCS